MSIFMSMKSQQMLEHLTSAETSAETTHELPERKDVAAEDKWRLEDLYASDEDWQKDAAQLTGRLAELAAMSGTLGNSAESFYAALKLQDELDEIGSRLFAYARMRRDEDNRNAKFQALADKAMMLMVQLQSASAFLVPEILSIPTETIRQFFHEFEPLGLYKFAVEEVLREKPHVLSTDAESILAQTEEIASAPQNIFSMFNDADLTFPSITDEEGKKVEVTHGRYMTFLESRNREVRKQAFDAVYSTYGKHQNMLAATYGASVKKDCFYARIRNYPSAREAALSPDDVPISVYDHLIDAVHSSLPALHKYLRLRKRVLKVDELHFYDLYTPLVAEVDEKIPYRKAVDTVLEALHPLGPDYLQAACRGLLEEGWVDVQETRGKTSGAYSWGAYGVHPYILLNYNNSLNHMFTLAHELGHAMHSYYSHREQPHVYANYTIFVAEVASTSNESLLFRHLLQTTEDKSVRASLINHHLETIRGTVIRQTMFAEFEKLTHAHVEAGEALTPEWLADTYRKLIDAYFGAVCVMDDKIAWEWSRIPHFYRAFYVYKYATGLSAATALSERILAEGDAALQPYLTFLKSGGSDHPIPLLQKAGVDMSTPKPVEATLQMFDALVDELAELLGVSAEA
ncbi:MAG: oligoendopeptidase F [Alicyclobacillaceae bacterium]|nr:oligoendopeptidase F [Alicyclobacillaceae bacterium]